MKEKFIDKKFGEQALQTIAVCDQITAEYAAAGLRMTVRQLYYQLVSRNIIPNEKRSYENLAALVSEARDAGYLDWDHIEDRGRVTRVAPTYASLKEMLVEAGNEFRLDRWEEQDHYVEVCVEKQALEGVLAPICDRLCVPLTANKGYASSSLLYARGKFIQSMRDVKHKDVHVLYLGDHDPSGIDMTRDIRERLERYSDGPVDVIRLALNIDQVESHDLPDNPAKLTDSRSASYVQQFGTHSWELDALNPRALANIVTLGVRQFVDQVKWKSVKDRQASQLDTLQNFIDSIA